MKFLVRDFNVHHLSSQGLSGIKILRTRLIVSCSLKATVTFLEKIIHTRSLLSSCSLLNSTDQLPDGPTTQYGTHSLRHGFESMNGFFFRSSQLFKLIPRCCFSVEPQIKAQDTYTHYLQIAVLFCTFFATLFPHLNE